MEPQAALAAIGEPTRYAIMRLLADAPRTVGEIATALGALQPQTTKHVQALAEAGVVEIHALGRRRVVALRRDAVADLAAALTELATPHPSEAVLEEYGTAVAREQALVAAGGSLDRELRVNRVLPGGVAAAWRAWTDPAEIRRWWAPEHFEVADCTFEARPGGETRIVLREGDGAEYAAIGSVENAEEPHDLSFTLTSLGGDGSPLFTIGYRVVLRAHGSEVLLALSMTVSDALPAAAPAVAGIEIGWRQTLDRLTALLA
jgi:uncharacterized protein YndB with AHSA1/START domain/DNA-binding transcriptional ArsR family regulator